MKLWKHDFIRMCIGNLLLFASLYMLLPLLPFHLSEKFHIPLKVTGCVAMTFALSIFLFGPFYGYLTDTFSRKRVYLISCIVLAGISSGYAISGTLLWAILLQVMQGSFFGLSSAMGITLAIDITHTDRRSDANICFNRAGQLGMLVGTIAGLTLYHHVGLQEAIHGSVITGICGLLFVSSVPVAFRAPIGVPVCSLDRFLLPQGWLPALNLSVVSATFGLLFVSVCQCATLDGIPESVLLFLAFTSVGFLLSTIADKVVLENTSIHAKVLIGLALEGFSMLSVSIYTQTTLFPITGVLVGCGIEMILSNFLLVFIKLSEHCQRGTANATHLFSWEAGIGIGIGIGYLLSASYSPAELFRICAVLAVFSLMMYLSVTRSYFQRRKVR